MKEGPPRSPPAKSETEKPPQNVEILERPEACYRIIFESHRLPHSLEAIGRPDAYALEGLWSGPEHVNEDFVGMWSAKIRSMRDRESGYKILAQKGHLERHHIPIYFIDVADPSGNFFKKVQEEFVISGLEAILGAAGVAYTAGKGVQATVKKEMSRRDFLKFAGAGIIGAKGGLQALELGLGRSASQEQEKFSQARRNLQTVQETIHPETNSVTMILRNALWAQKLISTANRMQGKTKPEIGVQIGAAHTGLIEMLKLEPKKRLAIIQKIATALAAKGIDIELSSVPKFEYSEEEQRWVSTEIFKDPELEKIEKILWPESTP